MGLPEWSQQKQMRKGVANENRLPMALAGLRWSCYAVLQKRTKREVHLRGVQQESLYGMGDWAGRHQKGFLWVCTAAFLIPGAKASKSTLPAEGRALPREIRSAKQIPQALPLQAGKGEKALVVRSKKEEM